MTRDDEVCLKLGREVVRMIHDLRKRVPAGDTGYGRRKFTFPGGEVQLILAADSELADCMENAAAATYDVQSVTPTSEVN